MLDTLCRISFLVQTTPRGAEERERLCAALAAASELSGVLEPYVGHYVDGGFRVSLESVSGPDANEQAEARLRQRFPETGGRFPGVPDGYVRDPLRRDQDRLDACGPPLPRRARASDGSDGSPPEDLEPATAAEREDAR